MEIEICKSCSRSPEDFVKRELAEPFATMIIDPPWDYTCAPGTVDNKKLSGYIHNKNGDEKYAGTIATEKLKTLPIEKLVGGYALLWTTMPFIRGALELLDAWGFDYITGMCWAKYAKASNAQPGLFGESDPIEEGHGYGGVGFWFLGNHELLLLGKRKGWPSIRTGHSSLIIEKKTRHSQKPDNVHSLCEEIFPGPYLELFGRRSRPGWTVLGNEAPGDGKDIFDSTRDLLMEHECK
jgi:N6-adenosine-specific RNA methylase IME4